MPFRAIEDFDLRQSMTAAYDLALSKLKLDTSSPLTGKLAVEIIAQCNRGLADPEALCDRAIAALGNSK
jgi:hypothetical protein